MTARLVLVIGDLFIPDRAPVSHPQLSFIISANLSSRIYQPRFVNFPKPELYISLPLAYPNTR